MATFFCHTSARGPEIKNLESGTVWTGLCLIHHHHRVQSPRSKTSTGLWLQEHALRRAVEFLKVKGSSNPADLMTKHLAREQVEQVEQYVEALNLDCREGHAATAVKLHSTQQRRTQDRHDAEPNTDYNRRSDDQTYTDGLAESAAKTDRTLAQGALSLAREALDSAAD